MQRILLACGFIGQPQYHTRDSVNWTNEKMDMTGHD